LGRDNTLRFLRVVFLPLALAGIPPAQAAQIVHDALLHVPALLALRPRDLAGGWDRVRRRLPEPERNPNTPAGLQAGQAFLMIEFLYLAAISLLIPVLNGA
jgi:hypothetical protein